MERLRLGPLVSVRRKALHLTQAQLAKDTFLSRNQISLIERDHVQGIELMTLARLVDPLEVRLCDLVTAWEESMWMLS